MSIRQNVFGDVKVLSITLENEATRRERELFAEQKLIEATFGSHTKLLHHPNGAPFIDSHQAKISISHSLTTCVLAIADSDVGIDVENDREQLRRVAPRVMTPDELEVYTPLEGWTLKEALFKAAGFEGVDFQKDIKLPLDKSQEAMVKGIKFRILASMSFEGGYMALVVKR